MAKYSIDDQGHVRMTCPAYIYDRIIRTLDMLIVSGISVTQDTVGDGISVGTMQRLRSNMLRFTTCSETDSESPCAGMDVTISLYPSEFSTLQFLLGFVFGRIFSADGKSDRKEEPYWHAVAEESQAYWQKRKGEPVGADGSRC